MSLSRHAVLSVALLALAPPAAAATFTVTRFDDPAPNGCLPADCSLREAVIAANTTPGFDTVALDAGTYVLSRAGSPGDPAAHDLDVTDRAEIVGKGALQTTIRAAFASIATDTRVINVPGASLNLRGVTLRDGSVGSALTVAEGGCFRASTAVISFNDVVVRNCRATFGGGVAIRGGSPRFDATTIRLNNATSGAGLALLGATGSDGSGLLIEMNTATSRGGGVYLAPVSPVVSTTLRWATGSQVVGNQAAEGGGMYIASGHTLRVEPLADSTPGDDELLFIAGNVATLTGGGLHNAGTLIAARLAVRANAANGASSDGGGLHSAGTTTVTDSEFAFNTAVRDGGGAIIRSPGSGRFERVSFADNYVGRYGGGLSNQAYTLLINVSTFSNDAASGGGLDFPGAGRMYHVSMLGDTGNALRAPGGPLVVNSVISGGCAPGSFLSLGGTNAQGSGFASCGAMPSYSAAQLGLGYAYTGGRFDAVAITAAGSVLRNAAPPVAEAPNDIRGWARIGASDIGVHEFDAIAP